MWRDIVNIVQGWYYTDRRETWKIKRCIDLKNRKEWRSITDHFVEGDSLEMKKRCDEYIMFRKNKERENSTMFTDEAIRTLGRAMIAHWHHSDYKWKRCDESKTLRKDKETQNSTIFTAEKKRKLGRAIIAHWHHSDYKRCDESKTFKKDTEIKKKSTMFIACTVFFLNISTQGWQ